MIGHGWRSSANQSMLIWELTLYKARAGTKNIILSLFVMVPERHKGKFQMAEGGKPTQVKEPHTDEPLGPMGIVNICQAAHHQQLIKDMLEDFQC